jgi:hypothetical protein
MIIFAHILSNLLLIKSTAFWDPTLYSPLEVYQCIRGMHCLCLQYLFKSTTKHLHCKQQYDLTPIVNIGQWREKSRESWECLYKYYQVTAGNVAKTSHSGETV